MSEEDKKSAIEHWQQEAYAEAQKQVKFYLECGQAAADYLAYCGHLEGPQAQERLDRTKERVTQAREIGLVFPRPSPPNQAVDPEEPPGSMRELIGHVCPPGTLLNYNFNKRSDIATVEGLAAACTPDDATP